MSSAHVFFPNLGWSASKPLMWGDKCFYFQVRCVYCVAVECQQSQQEYFLWSATQTIPKRNNCGEAEDTCSLQIPKSKVCVLSTLSKCNKVCDGLHLTQLELSTMSTNESLRTWRASESFWEALKSDSSSSPETLVFSVFVQRFSKLQTKDLVCRQKHWILHQCKFLETLIMESIVFLECYSN